MEVFQIFDYDIEQVIIILSNLKKIEITEEKIKEARHTNHRFGRMALQFSKSAVYDSLINKIPVGISKSNYNTFKIVHEHPRRKSQDIYLVISIDKHENVKLITAYSHYRKRRVRT